MNNDLQNFARSELKKTLSECTEKQQLFFKRMYSNGKLDMSINDVVDQIAPEKLDWAMQQVKNTLSKSKTGK